MNIRWLLWLCLLLPLPAHADSPPSQGSAPSLLRNVQDLGDQRIGVLLGSAHESYAVEHFPNAQILQYKSPADVVLAIKSNKIDAALYDAEPLRAILQQDKALGLLDENLFSFDVGIGFNKNNPRLRDQFNQFLASIQSNGIYDDMVERWMIRGETTMPDVTPTSTNGVLVVGVSDAGLPFTAVKDQQLEGFDIELAARFAAFQKKRVEFLNMDFGSLIAAVSGGKADMIASAIYVTDTRKKQIDFSYPYYQMATQVVALKKRLNHHIASLQATPAGHLMASLEDLHDKRIGVMLGSTHDTYVHQHYPDADILQYKSPSDVLLGVKMQKVDVGIYNHVSLDEILNTNPDIGVIGEPFEMMPVAFGFSKTNTGLMKKFNAFLAEIKSNGIYDQMIARWTQDPNPVMPKIETPNRNGLLVAGHLSDIGLPFATIRDNETIGLNIELGKRFAAWLGMDIRFDDMEFGSLMPATATGKIDFVAVSLMITEERKQKINFADPYYAIGMQAFALKKNIANLAPEQQDSAKASFFQGLADSFQNNIMEEKRYLLLWDGLKTTIVISILATIFGSLLGALVCYMRMSTASLLNIPAKIYISILRGMPVLVLLMLIFYVVFGSVNISPILVATIAFGMNFAAYVAEIFRTGLQSIDKGQMEAGIAMGFNKLKTFIYILLPQTIQRVLPVYKGEFISLVKMTSIVGYIAVQDLTKASDIIRSRTFDAFFPLIMIAILYFLIAWILLQALNYLEKVTDPKYRRRKSKT